jgi:hypothetical protein
VKIHPCGTHEWHHKDGRRRYWRIDASPTGNYHGNGQDEEWEYWIFKGNQSVGYGTIIHQRTLPHPRPHDIFNDWIASLLPVSSGFAQSTEEWYPEYSGEGKP